MTKSEVYSKGKKAAQVLLYLFESKYGKEYAPKVVWYGSDYNEQHESGEISFEVEFSFRLLEYDLGMFGKKMNDLDKKSWDLFSDYHLNKNIDVVKGKDENDAYCMLISVDYNMTNIDIYENNTKVKMSFVYYFYENEEE